jgi:hypothetical protein
MHIALDFCGGWSEWTGKTQRLGALAHCPDWHEQRGLRWCSGMVPLAMETTQIAHTRFAE